MAEEAYKPLPSSCTNSSATSKSSDPKKFLLSRLPRSEQKEVDDEMKKVLVLEPQKKKWPKHSKPRVSKSYLTAKERRQLGLYRLPKVGLKYSDYTELHRLWVAYMVDLLGLDSQAMKDWNPGNCEDSLYQSLQQRVYKADFHGAYIKVISAKAAGQLGIEGICLLESKYTVQLISKDNKLRMIPKKGTTFQMEVGGYKFTLPGSGIEVRPAERATKKPKLKPPIDF